MNATETCELDVTAWRAAREEAATRAGNQCSMSHFLYVVRFSEAVDALVAALPQEYRDQALKLAREWDDYASPRERQQEQLRLADGDCCHHGIEYGYCPAGCGEHDDDERDGDRSGDYDDDDHD